MKHVSRAVLMVLVSACAHRGEERKVVLFPYADELLREVQARSDRAPAADAFAELEERSPRRIYFSALYQQYLTLGQYLGQKLALGSCPQFHHDKVETDAGVVPKVSMYLASAVDEGGQKFFPELAFRGRSTLGAYHAELRSEIEILCEDGVSDNYFKFDNLVTHYAHKPSFHRDPRAMSSVLKIPVFANFYLIKMLERPGAERVAREDRRFIQLTRTYWFDRYVTEAGRRRGNYIKDKMVRR
jgi:hypothetical protein